ncbi:MAG: hypothetical protein ABSB12_00920 [Candidatus Saccharimonadales bacterium]|jgi:hypothetical protein
MNPSRTPEKSKSKKGAAIVAAIAAAAGGVAVIGHVTAPETPKAPVSAVTPWGKGADEVTATMGAGSNLWGVSTAVEKAEGKNATDADTQATTNQLEQNAGNEENAGNVMVGDKIQFGTTSRINASVLENNDQNVYFQVTPNNHKA